MALREFKLKDLGQIQGGALQIAFDRLVRAAVDDCDDRPAVQTARTVTLKMSLKPVACEKDLESVSVKFTLDDNLPKRETREVEMEARYVDGKLKLVFNDLTETDPQQTTIDMLDEHGQIDRTLKTDD
jgi:hypothetical protein